MLCGEGGDAKQIRRGGHVDILHEQCLLNHLAAVANPPIKLPPADDEAEPF
jgi:hypothetical protein